MARQSLVRFLRKQLKFPGQSEHSGRGFWMCDIDTTWEQFVARVQELEPKLKARGIVSAIIITDDSVDFKFVELWQHELFTEQVSRPVTHKFLRHAIENGCYYVDGSWFVVT